MIRNPVLPTSQRSSTIDTMKFLLILAIYVGHYGENSGLLFPFFSRFHVRVFFMISGLWAVKKSNYTILQRLRYGVYNYLVPWGIWVLFSTCYNAVLYSFDAHHTLEAFIMYFKSIRGSAEVGGMWFVPCFFMVSLVYHILLKWIIKIRIKNPFVQTTIITIFSFALYYCTCYVLPLPQDCAFSLHCIPEYLFVYSIGSTLYNIYIYIYIFAPPRCFWEICFCYRHCIYVNRILRSY